MKSTNRSFPSQHRTSVICGFGLLAMSLFPGTLLGDGAQPGQAVFRGHTHGEYAAMWWQWALSIPFDMNPVNDPTGDLAFVGQEGNVMFLAGTFGGDAERSISVPAGTAFFLPIWNFVHVTFPEDELQDPDEIIASTQDLFYDAAEEGTFSFEIDGWLYEDMDSFLTESPIFSTSLEIFGDSTVYSPSYTIGYFVLVPPLSVGDHYLVIKADVPDQELQFCVEYNIEITSGQDGP